MPNDVITLHAVAEELNGMLRGGRIEKVYQPEDDEVVLTVKNNARLYPLVISASPGNPRIHVTSQKKENALNAPAFCMLLRKYLIGATIAEVGIFNCDRIVKITFDARNELKDRMQYFLMVELMGRYSNVILTDSSFTIIDAVRRIHFDQSTTRYILPNLHYEIQPQNRIALNDKASLRAYFDGNNADPASFLQAVSGASKDTAKEMLSTGDPYERVCEFFNIISSPLYSPCIALKDGKITDYFVCPYRTKELEYVPCATLNEAVDKFYLLYDGNERKKANTKALTSLLTRLQNKIERRVEDNNKKLNESGQAEIYKQKGDLILSNLHLIGKNSDKLTCYDYYNDKQTDIALDPHLTPSLNAQSYYKKYAKLTKAALIAKEQLISLNEQREYLSTIEASIANCTLKQEYDEIYDELNLLNGLRKMPKKTYSKSKNKTSAPMHKVINGHDVYIGKNNLQNAYVTFELADGKDTWLHVKTYHGAHVIIKGSCDDDTVFQAAKLAAYYSDGKDNDKVEVDYTFRKNVKKIPSALTGMVTYVNYKTILVKPSDI